MAVKLTATFKFFRRRGKISTTSYFGSTPCSTKQFSLYLMGAKPYQVSPGAPVRQRSFAAFVSREDDYVLVFRKPRHADSLNETEVTGMEARVSEDENSAFDHPGL